MISIFCKTTRVFREKQTYLNLAYLGLNVAFGFAYYLTFQICLALAWGLVFPNIAVLTSLQLDWIARFKIASVILGGILILPILVWALQVFVVPEQWLANLLLKENIALDRDMWSKNSSLLRPGRLLVAASTWKRLLYMLLKIPLGWVSFFAIFTMLVPVLALFGMPLAYLAGFRNLIIGPWRFDSIEKTALAFLSGVLLLPLSLYAMKLLARLSGWLARILLPASRITSSFIQPTPPSAPPGPPPTTDP